MAIAAAPTRRVVIIGAGSSVPYSLPLAAPLMDDAIERVVRLDRKWHELVDRHYNLKSIKNIITQGNDIDAALIRSTPEGVTIEAVARSFREHLVHQNLDDFVRDHPSLTSTVSTLIVSSLFQALYQNGDGAWHLKNAFRVAGWDLSKDWMRNFVGLVRPLSDSENKLTIISFNYDSLLERSMHMYWGGSERKYDSLDAAVEFIYPHGKFSELPDTVYRATEFLLEQSEQIHVGENRNDEARARAKTAIAESTKIFSVGFSFTDSNMQLLGIDSGTVGKLYVQNFENRDIRLRRRLDQLGMFEENFDFGSMDTLVRNGFFEQ